MSNNSTDYNTPYDCPVVSARVIVTWRSVALPLGADQAKVMLGCTGNHLCKKFANEIDFTSRTSKGCPYHDSLITG